MFRFFLLVGVLLMTSTQNGCANSNLVEDMLSFEKTTPGKPSNNTYGIQFDPEPNVCDIKNCTYTYTRNNKTQHLINGKVEPSVMAGGRGGYGLFGDMEMHFRFLDGRKYHEILPFQTLIGNMVKKYRIHDLSKTPYGGEVDIYIRIRNNRLAVDYRIDQTTNNNLYEYENPISYLYPVFEKDLLPGNMTPETFPGNPEQGLCGLSFEIDQSIFVSGMYQYSPEGEKSFPMGKQGRYGYQSSGVLTLDFTLKDNRRIQEVIDVRPLIRKLAAARDMVDLDASNHGGVADIVVHIGAGRLQVDYRLLERKEKTVLPPLTYRAMLFDINKDRPAVNYRIIEAITAKGSSYKEHRYPLYEKRL